MFWVCLKPQNIFSIPAERKRLKMWKGGGRRKRRAQFIRIVLILTLKCWRPFQYFKQHMKPCGESTRLALEASWKPCPSGLPSDFAYLCFCVLHWITLLYKNLMPTQTKTRYFLPAQYAELACGGIKWTPNSVILPEVNLQRLSNRSVFPVGCDQYDFHLRNIGLTTPFQVRFKLGSCILWYVF